MCQVLMRIFCLFKAKYGKLIPFIVKLLLLYPIKRALAILASTLFSFYLFMYSRFFFISSFLCSTHAKLLKGSSGVFKT